MTSSGPSSPPSSWASFTFSSRSSSSPSPPSSQHSLSGQSSASSSASSPLPYPHPQPRIQVSSLLADPQTRSYHLNIVQQPQRTAEFGSARLSRLPITPPIIAQLTVRDPSGNSIIPDGELPFLIAHLSLYSGDGTQRLDMGSFPRQQIPILYGSLATTVQQLRDLDGDQGLFFVFPDVSIKTAGRYRLGVTLCRISSGHVPTGYGSALAQTQTRTFDTLPLTQYSAVSQTRLTETFMRQGAHIFLGKGGP